MHDAVKPACRRGPIACFKDSLLFQYWSKLGIKFREATDLKLRYEQHWNGNELTILYAVDQDWSKRLAKQKDRKVLRMMEEAVLKEFGEAEFLFAQNKGDNLFGGIKERDFSFPTLRMD